MAGYGKEKEKGFEQLTYALTKRAVDDDLFFDMLHSMGISHEDWDPEWPSTKTLAEYTSLRKDFNSETCAMKIIDFPHYAHIIGESVNWGPTPSDPQTLQVMYQSYFEKWRLIDWQRKILMCNTWPEAMAINRSATEGSQNMAKDVLSLSEYVEKTYLQEREKIIMRGEECIQIPFWGKLSNMIGGFNPSRLGVFIADTGFGKTNAALQLSLDASTQWPALYLNMEMSAYDITHRILTCVTGLEYKEMYTDKFNVGNTIRETKRRSFHYTSGRDLTVGEVGMLARRYKRSHDIRILVVDYDQKLVLDGRDEEWRELQRAAVWLESLAKELGIYVLLLAQSNHQGGISGSKRSMFPASTVMMFEEHAEFGPIIRTLKNRFGKRNAALKVDYFPAKCMLRETEGFTYVPTNRHGNG
jgi:hypothetical protein